MARDLFLLALLSEFFLEKGRFLTQPVFVMGAGLLAFLLGVGDRLAARTLQQGLSIAGLMIMIGFWTARGMAWVSP